MNKSKRGGRSSSSSSVEITLGSNKKIRKSSTGTMEDEEHSTLKDLITSLSEEMRNSFNNLQGEMTKLRMNAQKFRAKVGHSQKTNLPSFLLFREI